MIGKKEDNSMVYRCLKVFIEEDRAVLKEGGMFVNKKKEISLR